jgi:hypothetical protein
MLGSLQSNTPKQYFKLVEEITNTNQLKTSVEVVRTLYKSQHYIRSYTDKETNIRELELVKNNLHHSTL